MDTPFSRSKTTNRRSRPTLTSSSRAGLVPPQDQTVEKAHGRHETRRIWTSTALNDYTTFPYCGQLAHIERITTEISNGQGAHRARAIITSRST